MAAESLEEKRAAIAHKLAMQNIEIARNMIEQHAFVMMAGNLWLFADGMWKTYEDSDAIAWLIKLWEPTIVEEREMREQGRSDVVLVPYERAKKILREITHRAVRINRGNSWRRRWRIKDAVAVHDEETDYAIRLKNGIFLAHNYVMGIEPCFIEPNRDYFIRDVTDYEYDSTAKCPLWLDKLNEWQPDVLHQQMLQEWFGLCCVYDNRFQKFLCLIGEPRSGKGVIKRVLEMLVGAEQVSNTGISSFGEQFAKEEMIGRLVNIDPDAAPVRLSPKAEQHLKSITGDDRIGVDRKNQRQVSVQLSVRVMVLMNEWFTCDDRTGAVAERMLVLDFPRSYASPHSLVLDPHTSGKIDNQLSTKLSNELSGIFNWAMEGLRRLRQNNGFTVSPTVKRLVNEFRSECNHVERFLSQHYEPADPTESIRCSWVQEAYAKWVKENLIPNSELLNESRLGKEVHRRFPEVKRDREGAGDRQWFYFGMKKRREPEQELSEREVGLLSFLDERRKAAEKAAQAARQAKAELEAAKAGDVPHETELLRMQTRALRLAALQETIHDALSSAKVQHLRQKEDGLSFVVNDDDKFSIRFLDVNAGQVALRSEATNTKVRFDLPNVQATDIEEWLKAQGVQVWIEKGEFTDALTAQAGVPHESTTQVFDAIKSRLLGMKEDEHVADANHSEGSVRSASGDHSETPSGEFSTGRSDGGSLYQDGEQVGGTGLSAEAGGGLRGTTEVEPPND